MLMLLLYNSHSLEDSKLAVVRRYNSQSLEDTKLTVVSRWLLLQRLDLIIKQHNGKSARHVTVIEGWLLLRSDHSWRFTVV